MPVVCPTGEPATDRASSENYTRLPCRLNTRNAEIGTDPAAVGYYGTGEKK